MHLRSTENDLPPAGPSIIVGALGVVRRYRLLDRPRLEFSGSFRQRIGCTAGSHQGHRRHVADCPVRPILVVVLTPILHLLARVGKRQEPMLVQALRPEATVEGFEIRIVGRLAGS